MLATGRNADGRLECFRSKSDQSVEHRWQKAPGGGWTDWVPLGSGAVAAKGLSVQSNADGRMEAFAEAADGSVWQCWQIAPNATWKPWVQV